VRASALGAARTATTIAAAKIARTRMAEAEGTMLELRSRLPAAAAARALLGRRRASGHIVRIGETPPAHPQDGLATLRHGGKPTADEPRSVSPVDLVAVRILDLRPGAASYKQLRAEDHCGDGTHAEFSHCAFLPERAGERLATSDDNLITPRAP
jgi:hypothetical protein